MHHFLQRLGFARSRTYLDYAAATPVRAEVLRAMVPYQRERFANPSAIHREGREVRRAVESARTGVARVLRVRADGVTFTSGGTEANNLALVGTVEAALAAGRCADELEVISTELEHASVLATLEALRARGVRVVYAPVGSDGRISIAEFEKLLSPRTLLVSVAYVNSEIGVVQDVRRMARSIRSTERAHGTDIYFHTDASQAPLWLGCALDALDVDLMTLDAGKCYGPKGVGALVHRRQVPLLPLVRGGGQEQGLRSGTEPVSLIVGFAEALRIAQEGVEERASRITKLRDGLIAELERVIPNLMLNGSREHRVANNVNVSVPGINGEFAVVSLDVAGIAASTRSACEGAAGGGSHVVRALSGDEERARSTMRFTLGEETTRRDIHRAARALAAHVQRV